MSAYRWGSQLPVRCSVVSVSLFHLLDPFVYNLGEARRGTQRPPAPHLRDHVGDSVDCPLRHERGDRSLRGRLKCGLCGRKLQCNWNHGEAYYRCTYAEQYARSARLDHPRVVYVRERDLLPHLDAWLSTIFDPEHIDGTCEAIVGAVDTEVSIAERAKANARLRECDRKLDRYRALLEAGTDPVVVSSWITEVEAERATANAALRVATTSTNDALATTVEVREAVEELGGLIGLLQVSEPKLRSRFYEEAGLTATYDPATRSVEAAADLGVRKVRVGGGT